MSLKGFGRKKVITIKDLREIGIDLGKLTESKPSEPKILYVRGGKRYIDPGEDYLNRVSINEKLLKDMTKALRKFNDAAQEIYPERMRSTENPIYHLRLAENFDKISRKFWDKYGRYINYLYFERNPIGIYEFDDETTEDEEETAEWFNLEYIKNFQDLRLWWGFIKEWKRYLHSLEYIRRKEYGTSEGADTRNKKKLLERNYYMRQRGKELRNQGKSRKQIYAIVSSEILKIFQYCPGQVDARVRKKYRTYQDASHFWRIVYSRKYDNEKCNYLRPRYEELKREALT